MVKTGRPMAAGKAELREAARMAEQERSSKTSGVIPEKLERSDVAAQLFSAEDEGGGLLEKCAVTYAQTFPVPPNCPLHHHAWAHEALGLQEGLAKLRPSLAEALRHLRRPSLWERVADEMDPPIEAVALLRMLIGYTSGEVQVLSADEVHQLLALRRILDARGFTMLDRLMLHAFGNAGGPGVLRVFADCAAEPVAGRGGIVDLMCRALMGNTTRGGDGNALQPSLRPWVSPADVDLVMHTARALFADTRSSPETLMVVCFALNPLVEIPAVAARAWELVGDAVQNAAASGALPHSRRDSEPLHFQDLLRQASVGVWKAETGRTDCADAKSSWALFHAQYRKNPAGFRLCEEHPEPVLYCR